jgi:hypothetical protein
MLLFTTRIPMRWKRLEVWLRIALVKNLAAGKMQGTEFALRKPNAQILRFRQWLPMKNNSHGKKRTENTKKSNDNSFYA